MNLLTRKNQLKKKKKRTKALKMMIMIQNQKITKLVRKLQHQTDQNLRFMMKMTILI